MFAGFTNLSSGNVTRWVDPKPLLLKRDKRGYNFGMFFDQQKVIQAIGIKAAQDFAGLGFYTRKAIKNSMKSGKSKAQNKSLRQKRGIRSSKPGEPPRYITGALRDNVLFSYDPKKRSLVVGPRRLNDKSFGASSPIPQVLNEGGAYYQTLYAYRHQDGTVGKFKRKNSERIKVGRKIIEMEARPYNGPAAKNWPKILQKWRGLIAKNQLRESQATKGA